MQTLGYYNGESGPLEDMKVPMNDRACWFGDGVYDATCAANHIIFALDDHVDRFFNSAALLKINLSFTKEELKRLLSDLVLKVDSPDQFVYWQVTRGTGIRSHEFPENSPSNLWVMLKPAVERDIYQKIQLILAEDTRYLHCNIKTLNLIPNVMASEKAKQAGCFEAVFHRGDKVTECAHSNVHILQNGVFITHPADHFILPGIGRAHLIKHCRILGIPVMERPFTVDELFNADEIIVSSAATFCLSADKLDNIPVGGKAPALLKKLQDAAMNEFHEATNSDHN